MKLIRKFLLMLVVVQATGSHCLNAAEVTVFAAASLTDSLKEIAVTYEKISGDKITFNFDASSTLERQIEAGAPCDIFFSADEAKMDALDKKGLLEAGTRKSRLGNSLVIVVPVENSVEIKSANDLAGEKVKRLALAEPATVPAGIYAKAYLEKQNLWGAVKDKVIPTQNVRAALAAVESGNVEAGIVFKTDAMISKRVKVAFEIPREGGPKISYPVALLTDSKQPEAAKKFLLQLESKEASAVFVKSGFLVHD